MVEEKATQAHVSHGPVGLLGPDGFRRQTGVSRETLAKLERYAELLRRWQQTINLVSPASLTDLWRRHMLDSAQIFPLLPPGAAVSIDMGTGAGFPGLVLAILGVSRTHLIEADARKCAFLREVARETGLITGGAVQVHHARLESFRMAGGTDAITARALARLDELLAYADPFIASATVCIFPKGRNVNVELTQALERWNMRVERFPSLTDRSGTILRLSHVHRRTER